ncbi:unnamed protein product [Protopolystoma xenopodis]|uniref:Uncharacterized protein n=1 Tax=Protopolystoma xenopodis TaxID=117903 RepID=A0A3S5A147_9PLAT|nr:unnamed protein product [Protopolystoma xenopodis]
MRSRDLCVQCGSGEPRISDDLAVYQANFQPASGQMNSQNIRTRLYASTQSLSTPSNHYSAHLAQHHVQQQPRTSQRGIVVVNPGPGTQGLRQKSTSLHIEKSAYPFYPLEASESGDVANSAEVRRLARLPAFKPLLSDSVITSTGSGVASFIGLFTQSTPVYPVSTTPSHCKPTQRVNIEPKISFGAVDFYSFHLTTALLYSSVARQATPLPMTIN